MFQKSARNEHRLTKVLYRRPWGQVGAQNDGWGNYRDRKRIKAPRKDFILKNAKGQLSTGLNPSPIWELQLDNEEGWLSRRR